MAYRNLKERKELGLCRNCPNETKKPYGLCVNCLLRQRATGKIRVIKLKKEIVKAYGGKCACCGETTFEFLSIDHAWNDTIVHQKEIGFTSSGARMYYWLKKNGFPKNRFQLLCFNCNFAKGYYGKCPHQQGVVNRHHATLGQ